MELSPASETQNMPRLFRTLAGCSSTGRKGASRAQQGSLDTSGHASFHRAGLAQRRRQRARQREALHRRRHHRDHPCSVATRSSGPLQPWLSGLARRHRYAPFVLSAQMPLSSREGNLVSNELDKRPPFTSTRPSQSWLGSLARRCRYAPFVLSAQRLFHDVTSPADADFLRTHNEGMGVMAPDVQAHNESMSAIAPNV
jgi:hypothetical protein